MRVIHYDRNLGKGYAVKLGALAVGGRLGRARRRRPRPRPVRGPGFLDAARREGLDFAIGSKRHPDSLVDYPRSRRVMSWGYQQLNRAPLRARRLGHAGRAQGLPPRRRRGRRPAAPREAVRVRPRAARGRAKPSGYGRVRELPVRLEYRFSGSGVGLARGRPGARRHRRGLLPAPAPADVPAQAAPARRRGRCAASGRPCRSSATATRAAGLDYPRARPRRGAPPADLVAVLAPGAPPAGNWVSAAVPYLARPDVAAVVAPSVTPPDASLRERAAAAVLESRLGGGSRRSAYFPGNVGDRHRRRRRQPRRPARGLGGAPAAGSPRRSSRRRGSRSGGGAPSTRPDTIVAAAPRPLFGPHLRDDGPARPRARRGGARTRGQSLERAPRSSPCSRSRSAVVGLVLLARRARAPAPAPARRRTSRSSPRRRSRRCGSGRSGSGSSPRPRSC